MQLNSEVINGVTYLVGTPDAVDALPTIRARITFDDMVISFLNDVSRKIMDNPESKRYSDVVTFAFWIRKASTLKLKERFGTDEVRLGKGVVFHIAPSNVPVNFAYSLVSGLITGNANVVRVPSKYYRQVDIITESINKVLEQYEGLRPYIICVKYDREKNVNDLFSILADMRVVWGGDRTISELRNSPMKPRSGEITFADRYSIAVIDSDRYLSIENKTKVADDFYNDTYLSDQNACTSPRIIVWTGEHIDEAKEEFWRIEHDIIKGKYSFQPIQAVNKLTNSYLVAAKKENVKIIEQPDNLIVRLNVDEIADNLMDYRENSGFFYEYDCRDIMDIIPLCNDCKCQTIGYLGDPKTLMPLIESGIKGVDRIVPIGKTMDFDLIWDGYNLFEMLSRIIVVYG